MFVILNVGQYLFSGILIVWLTNVGEFKKKGRLYRGIDNKRENIHGFMAWIVATAPVKVIESASN